MDITFSLEDVCAIYSTKEFYDGTGKWKSKEELRKMFKGCEYGYSESGDIYVYRNGTKDLIAVINIHPIFLDKLIMEYIDNEI